MPSPISYLFFMNQMMTCWLKKEINPDIPGQLWLFTLHLEFYLPIHNHCNFTKIGHHKIWTKETHNDQFVFFFLLDDFGQCFLNQATSIKFNETLNNMNTCIQIGSYTLFTNMPLYPSYHQEFKYKQHKIKYLSS